MEVEEAQLCDKRVAIKVMRSTFVSGAPPPLLNDTHCTRATAIRLLCAVNNMTPGHKLRCPVAARSGTRTRLISSTGEGRTGVA